METPTFDIKRQLESARICSPAMSTFLCLALTLHAAETKKDLNILLSQHIYKLKYKKRICGVLGFFEPILAVLEV